MTPPVSAGSITDAEFLNQSRITHSATFQIVCSFGIAVQLKLIKSGRLLQQSEKRGRGAVPVRDEPLRLVEG